MSLHPQVVALLDRIARSPLPPYYELPPTVARRMYRDSRLPLLPDPPAVERIDLRVARTPAGAVAIRQYTPLGAAKDSGLPALLYYHGGGWVIGDLDTHDVLCRTIANSARCAVFSVEYRKAPEAPFPAAVDDAFASLKYVASEAAALGVDKDRIAVGGDSAGGNLATVTTLLAREAGGPSIAFQLLIYPATDQHLRFPSIERNGEGYLLTKRSMDYFRGHYVPNPQDWLDWRASPLLAKSLANLSPALVLTAGYDPLLDEGKAYADRLAAEGVTTEYRNYPDMVHGFLPLGRVLDTANAALDHCARALHKALGS